MPRLRFLVFCGLLPTPRRSTRSWHLAQLRGAPGQVTVSLCAMVASVSSPHGIVGSWCRRFAFRSTIGSDRILPPTFTFAPAPHDTAYLTAEMQSRHRGASRHSLPASEFLRDNNCCRSIGPRVVLQAASSRRVDHCQPVATGRQSDRGGARCAAAGMGERGDGRYLWIRSRQRRCIADRRKGCELHGCRGVSRLRAATGAQS